MADQDIQFKVTADVQDAKQGFEEVQQKVDGLKGKAQETVPVMDEVSETMKDAGESAEELGTSASGLSSILVMGLAAGAIAASLAIIGLIKDMLQTDGAVENLTAKIKEHWTETYKAKVEWEKFNEEIKKFANEDVIASIDGINLRLLELQLIMNRNVSGQFLEMIGWYADEIDNLTKSLGKLEEQQRRNNAMGFMKEQLGWNWDELKDSGIFDEGSFWDKKKSDIKEAKEELINFEKLESEYVKWLRDVEKNQRTRMPYATGGKTTITGGRGKSKGGKEEAGMTQQFAEDMAFMDGLIMSSAGLLRSEFMQAWEDIFGEANSLFEKFIANIVSAFADLAAQKMAMGIFGFFASLFTGGAASAVTAIASSPSSGTPIQNNIIIDGRQTAIIYTNGKMNASRLRMD